MISQEKIAALEERQKQLLEIFLEESDPDNWRESAGDRLWDKKNAAQTLAVVCRIQTLFQYTLKGAKDAPDAPQETFDVEAEEKRALRDAERILAKVGENTRPPKKR